MHRPRPLPSAETQPFWDGLAAHELRLGWCMGCARFRHPEALLCPDCLGAVEWRRVSGAVELYSWTVVRRPFTPGFEPPYAVAAVAPVEAPEVLLDTVLPLAHLDGLTVGTPGSLVFLDDPHGWTIHAYEPRKD